MKANSRRFPFIAILTLATTTLAGGRSGTPNLTISEAANPALKEYADLLRQRQSPGTPTESRARSSSTASIQGMLDDLDPHTNFLEPERRSG